MTRTILARKGERILDENGKLVATVTKDIPDGDHIDLNSIVYDDPASLGSDEQAHVKPILIHMNRKRGRWVPEGMTIEEITEGAKVLEREFDIEPYTSDAMVIAILQKLRALNLIQENATNQPN